MLRCVSSYREVLVKVSACFSGSSRLFRDVVPFVRLLLDRQDGREDKCRCFFYFIGKTVANSDLVSECTAEVCSIWYLCVSVGLLARFGRPFQLFLGLFQFLVAGSLD